MTDDGIVKKSGGVQLSIVVPCYNVEAYLDDCIYSLLNQVDMVADEFEVICVDDGSTDGTLNKLEMYSARFTNIRVISSINKGVSTARNIGIEHSTGEYITFVDPDDAVPVDLFSNVKKIINNNSGIDIIIGCFQGLNDDIFSQRTDYNSEYSHYRVISDRAQVRKTCVQDFSNGTPQGSAWAQFISRELLNRSNIRFRENLCIGEDSFFTFELRAVAEKIIFIPTILYFYRMRQGSVMRTFGDEATKKRQTSHKNIALLYQEKCHKDPLAVPYYIYEVNQTCFMLLFINDKSYVRNARTELKELGFYPPKSISESCEKDTPKSIKLYILDKLKRMLKYPILFWPIWFVYGYRRR